MMLLFIERRAAFAVGNDWPPSYSIFTTELSTIDCGYIPVLYSFFTPQAKVLIKKEQKQFKVPKLDFINLKPEFVQIQAEKRIVK